MESLTDPLLLSDPLALSSPLVDLTSHHSPARPSLPRRYLFTPSPSHVDDYILHLDYSHGISPFLECPRRWENLNVHSREANRPTSALSWGTLFHSCEEYRLRHGLSDRTREAQRAMVSAHFLSNPVPPNEYRNEPRMLKILDKYNALHALDGWPESIHVHEGRKAVEIPFKIELATLSLNTTIPYARELLVAPAEHPSGDSSAFPSTRTLPIRNLHIFYTGKIDAIIENSGVLWVVDHKTSSRGGREFEEAFRLSLQTRGYCWAAQKVIGRPVAGLCMNALVVRPETKSGKGEDFDRHWYPYAQWSLDEWEQDVLASLEDIVACLSRGYFPQTSRSFKSPCASCDFADNCTLPPNQRSADLASLLYRDVTWSPMNDASGAE